MSDIYVVIGENPDDPNGPLVFEAYVNKSSKEEAIAFSQRLSCCYGPCRIAKVVEVDDD